MASAPAGRASAVARATAAAAVPLDSYASAAHRAALADRITAAEVRRMKSTRVEDLQRVVPKEERALEEEMSEGKPKQQGGSGGHSKGGNKRDKKSKCSGDELVQEEEEVLQGTELEIAISTAGAGKGVKADADTDTLAQRRAAIQSLFGGAEADDGAVDYTVQLLEEARLGDEQSWIEARSYAVEFLLESSGAEASKIEEVLSQFFDDRLS